MRIRASPDGRRPEPPAYIGCGGAHGRFLPDRGRDDAPPARARQGGPAGAGSRTVHRGRAGGPGAAVPDRRTGPAGPPAHRRSPAPRAVPRHGRGHAREGVAGGPGSGPGAVRPVPPARPDHLARRAAHRQGPRPPARRGAPAHRRGEGVRVLDRLRPGPRRSALQRAGGARLRHHHATTVSSWPGCATRWCIRRWASSSRRATTRG
ncbi:MAG: hypothetical protein MZV63_18115 [Marinilabiliales bacterium]|nr:hypothetical protein [Marinilabiliales bacterium]